MQDLISIEKIIEDAKSKGIEFGKGDPYNRLRYYTKIGWLPHMERKKDEEDVAAKGHYPKWALKRLIQLERYKDQGLSNDEISKKVKTLDKMQSLQVFITSAETRLRIVTYISFIALLIILGSELGLVNLGKSKNKLISNTQGFSTLQIIDSGTAFVPRETKKIMVISKEVQTNSKIYVTFNQDYSPASRYWVSDKVPQEGFYIELDSPTAGNTEFNWWITN
jgi:hypothetical protein